MTFANDAEETPKGRVPERHTYYHKATSRGPAVNWIAGGAMAVWVLLFFADILNLAFLEQVWLDEWIGPLDAGLAVITLLLRWVVLRRSGEYVELDDSSIRHVRANGWSTRLLWTDVVDLRPKGVTGSFELVGFQGGRAVPIHRGLEAFGMLMTDVISQLDRHRMRRRVSDAGLNSVGRPKTYMRNWWWQAGLGVLWR